VRLNERVHVSGVGHTVLLSVMGHLCRPCDLRGATTTAAHKVGEEATSGGMHNLTAYLCCECFQALGCDCSSYPYDLQPPNLGNVDVRQPTA
jgi:hypothetical protein